MKVIEDNSTKIKSWKIVCDECNSVLEFNRNDVISKESHFFYLHYIKCPCCGKDIDVKHW